MSTAAAVAALVKALRQYPLLSAEQLAEVRGPLLARFPDPDSLLQELARRGWLTAYQADLLAKGRAADLVLGSYVLLEPLGEGGMGQVFKARNPRLGRIDAVKVIHAERLNSPDALKRFQREVRAVAQLSHPNVVHAYDAGEVRGRHYFAMELVNGRDLSQVVKQQGPLPVRKACEYVRQAALGLQHAHGRGLIHRDVKPHNLLVTPAGEVKILDLGLARLAPGSENDGTLTADGAVMGTPDYLAPEQARQSHTVDARADLYSLGCTLYFLLAGRPPYPPGPLAMKVAAHLFDEPEPVEAARPDTPPAVAAVVRKLMAKKPEDRYQTAGALAKELSEILRSKGVRSGLAAAPAAAVVSEAPTVAVQQTVAQAPPRPPPARRRRWLFPLAAVVVLLGGLAGLAWVLGSAFLPRGAPGQVLLATGDGDATVVVRRKGAPDTVAEIKPGGSASLEPGEYLLELGPTALPGLRLSASSVVVKSGGRENVRVEGAPLGSFALVSRPAWIDGVRSWTLTTRAPRGTVERLAYSPDGRWLAVTSLDGPVRLMNAADGLLDRALVGHNGVVHALTWSRDKRNPTLASAADDGTVLVWDAASGRLILTLPIHTVSITLSPDGKMLACAAGDDVQVWEVESGKQVNLLPGRAPVRAVAWSPDGAVLASAGHGRMVQLWRVPADPRANWQVILSEKKHPQAIEMLAWSSEGKTVVSGSADGTIVAWPDQGKGTPVVITQFATLHDLASSPDGSQAAAVYDKNDFVLVWDVRAGKLGQNLGAYCPGNRAVAWSPDGKTIASSHVEDYRGKRIHVVKYWNAATGKTLHTRESHAAIVRTVAWSPDGAALATDGGWGGVQTWDALGGERRRTLGPVTTDIVGPTAWTGDGKAIVAEWDNQLHRWNLADGSTRDFPPGHVGRFRFSPREPLLAALSGPDVVLRDAEAGATNKVLEGRGKNLSEVAWNGDGTALATGADDGVVLLRESADWSKARKVSQPSKATALAWSPDDKTLAAGGDDGTVRLWNRNAADGAKPQLVLAGNHGLVRSLAWLREPALLAAVCAEGRLLLWDPKTGELQRTFPCDPRSVHFSPDGRLLAGGGGPWTVRLTETATGRPLGTVIDVGAGWVVLSEDGHYRCENAEVEKELVYVVETDQGQETLAPAEFLKKYGRTNDPARARLDTRARE